MILIILDTTRADHLSVYGYERETTPHLEQLAAEGELYTQAWSQAPWTLPSIATILTGLPPHAHGAGKGERGVLAVRPTVKTLAQRMSAAGYATCALMNVVWCDGRLSALDRGYDHYDLHTTDESNQNHRDAATTVDLALDWMRSVGERPAFLTVHLFDPHLTYDPPAPYDTVFEPDGGPRIARGFGTAHQLFAVREGRLPLDERQRQSLIARYDGELAFTDQQIGRLRAGLEELGRWKDAMVIVVGDHGEEFWDHGGFEHGHSHYAEMLNVPLIVKRPGAEVGSVSSERVRQLDVVPTVLEFAQVPGAAKLPGQRLGSGGVRYAIAEGSLWAGDLVSIRSDQGTLIWHRKQGWQRFFAGADELELEALDPLPAEGEELLRLLRALPSAHSQPGTETIPSQDQLELLKELGYTR